MANIIVTQREAEIIRRAVKGTQFEDLKFTWANNDKRNVRIETLKDAQNVYSLIHIVRDLATSRGTKQVASRLLNRWMDSFAMGVAKDKERAANHILRLEMAIEREVTPLDYFLDRKVSNDQITVRVRPTNGKHGNASLTKFYIAPRIVQVLGDIRVEFEVRGNGEKLTVPTLDIADEIVRDLARAWAHDYDAMNAAKIDEYKNELAEMKKKIAA